MPHGDGQRRERRPGRAATRWQRHSRATTADDDGQSNSGPGDGRRDADDGDTTGDDDGQDEAEHCTTAALVPGAVVREAELSVSSAGAVWEKVELNQ